MLGNSGAYGDGGRHHLCAGLKWLERARSKSDPKRSGFVLGQAAVETQYTLERTSRQGYMYIVAVMQMASVLYEQGECLQALGQLNIATLKAPNRPMLYVAQATVCYKHNEFELARDSLLMGIRDAEENSVDLYYNLGLDYLEFGEPESRVCGTPCANCVRKGVSASGTPEKT